MKIHQCFIGYVIEEVNSTVVTLNSFKNRIFIKKNTYDYFKGSGMKGLIKPYSFSDYFDKEKVTDLFKFTFCPVCGKEIDWEAIQNENH